MQVKSILMMSLLAMGMVTSGFAAAADAKSKPEQGSATQHGGAMQRGTMQGGGMMGHGGMMAGDGMMGGGMMEMMSGCRQMMESASMPRLPSGNDKLQLQMHAEMMQRVGEILGKYADRIEDAKRSAP
jgi:hypothetical protein